MFLQKPLQYDIVDSDVHAYNSKRTHCCLSVTRVVTRTRPIVTVYIQYIDCRVSFSCAHRQDRIFSSIQYEVGVGC